MGGIETGLLGVVAGFNFKHDINAGYIDWSASDFGGQDSSGLAPKVINMSFQFTVLHEEDLGWDLEGNWRGDYGAGSVFPFKDRKTPKQAPVPVVASADDADAQADMLRQLGFDADTGNPI